MTMRDRLIRLAAFKLLGDEVGRAYAIEKAGLAEEVGGRLGGAAAVVDDVEIATVSIAKGRYPQGTVKGWQVIDPDAFATWVKGFRPTAIVERVRESDQTQILNSMERYMEKNGGVVPPGVREASRGADYVLVNQSPEQRANAISLYRAGRLDLPTMDPQIEGGTDE